jgi:4-hydroxythreonine-4-phosphate dehydrogenase
MKPRIALTLGDPCGIGPEIIAKFFASRQNYAAQEALLVLGDPLAMERAVGLLGVDLTIQLIADLDSWPEFQRPGTIPVYTPQPLALEDLTYGAPSRNACLATIRYIEEAVKLAMDGKIDAVCTGPIHKGNLHRHGFSFPGHTEFLRELTSSPRVVMMLAGPRLRVSLVTIHEPLCRVPELITEENLRATINISGASIARDFGIRFPRIAVAALNPHAGEDGRFGREEIDLISPVIQSYNESNANAWSVTGPYPADTLFFRAFQGEFDAVVAMYHDQGLVPIKLVHFHDAVNVTLGLPIVRTSVDHGTAYELAGTGQADPGSLDAAVRLALQMTLHRSAQP